MARSLYVKVVSYESSSGGILDTIADMQSKAEESLSSTRKDEMEAAHAYAGRGKKREGKQTFASFTAVSAPIFPTFAAFFKIYKMT